MIDKQNRQRWRRVATGLVLVFVLALSLSAVGTAAASDDGGSDAPVAEESNFEVSIDNVEIETLQTLDEGGDSTSFPGVRLNVVYSVVNTGDASDTQTITLVGKSDLATVQLGSQNVSLAPGQSHSDRFSHSLDSFGESCLPPCEPVSGTLVLSSEDDTDTKTVSLSQSPRFVIDGVQTNSPVEGEDLVVDVAVRNAGGASGTQTLDVDAGPLGSESATLSLKAGELTTQTVVIPTSAGDAGTYDLSASTENDTATTGVEVRSGGGGEAFFAVSIENTKVEMPDPEQPIIMSSGWTATVAVEYTVANAGNASDTQQIGFSVAGEQQDNETVTLDAGQSHAGEFVADVPIFGILTEPNVVPAPPYEAEVTVAVSSADDRAEETVVVGPGEGSAEFVIEGIETNEPVEGDDLVAEVRLSNVGDASGTQSLDVDAGPLGSDSASVSLASGESTSQSFAFSTSQGDAGIYDLSATTADDSAGTAFSVRPADGGEANFDVSIDDARVEVPDPGEPVPLPPVEEPIEFGFGVVVEYTVENTGNASDTQQIGFEIEDRQRDATELRLDAGESASGTFSHSLSVYGEDGEGVLAGGASGEMQEVINETSLLPEPPYVPELTVAVTSEDDRAEETISLDPGEEPPTFEIGEVTTNDPVAGDDLEVSVQVTNTGDVVDSQQLTVDAGDLGSSSQLLLLAGGESATQTVAFSTSEGDAGTYAVTAATGDDRANATARVRAGDEDAANFDVSIDDARVELPGSGPIVWPATEFEFGVVVEYTVENTGNASDTQPIVLAVEDDPTNKTTASLGPGERAAGTLSATVPIIKPLSSPAVIPEPPYTPEVTVAISSEDDRAEETVALEPPVEEPPTFVIDSINASSPVAGEELVVDLQVTNTGDVVDSQTVAVDAGELGRESRLQLLGPGETVVQRFTFPTGAGDAGTYDVTAETGDDRASTTATVQPVDDSEAVFEVDIDDTRVNVSSPIQPGPLPPVDSTIDLNVTLEADYTVANAGNATDTQAVVFAVNDERQASEQVSLGAGERTSGTFSTQLSVSEIQPPDRPCLVPHGEACLPHVTVVISTDDDRATEEVTIGPGGGPMPTVTENPPLDLDGDGLHEDLRGDGQANILDVQALFNLLGDDRVQQNADAFSFQSDGAGEVTILDVQGLFNELDRADS